MASAASTSVRSYFHYLNNPINFPSMPKTEPVLSYSERECQKPLLMLSSPKCISFFQYVLSDPLFSKSPLALLSTDLFKMTGDGYMQIDHLISFQCLYPL